MGFGEGWYFGSVTRRFSCQEGEGRHERERSGALLYRSTNLRVARVGRGAAVMGGWGCYGGSKDEHGVTVPEMRADDALDDTPVRDAHAVEPQQLELIHHLHKVGRRVCAARPQAVKRPLAVVEPKPVDGFDGNRCPCCRVNNFCIRQLEAWWRLAPCRRSCLVFVIKCGMS